MKAILPLLSLTTACAGPAVVAFDCGNGEPLCESRPLATDIDIDSVALYQGVQTWLMEDGLPAEEATVPIASGRQALVRIFVQPRSEFAARDIVGQVTFFDDDGFLHGYEQQLPVDGPSDEDDLGSTFNLPVTAEDFAPGVRYQISLREAHADTKAPTPTGRASWPADADGPSDVTTADGGGPVRLLLVPVEYGGEGGRLPDTSETQLETYRQTMFKMYPATEIEIEVAEPWPYTGTVSANGSGWSELLSAVGNLRGSLGADDDQYIYGLFNPSDSFSSFCGSGCVTGLSNVGTSASDAYTRASIGVGFTGDTSAETMVHEVGHAHGRSHSPSGGASDVDPNYPYEDGTIGVTGYDLLTDELKDKSTYYDFMGYQPPIWVSDYTYDALFTRIQQVNELAGRSAARVAADRVDAVAVLQLPDGSLQWIGPRRVARDPDEATRRVELLDAQGRSLGLRDAWFVPLDHLDGGTLTIPQMPDQVDRVAFDGMRTGPRLR